MDKQFFKQTTGREGSVVIATTAEFLPTPGKIFYLVSVIEAAIFAAATQSNVRNLTGGTGFPAGTIIPGVFDRITLTSGKVQAIETTA